MTTIQCGDNSFKMGEVVRGGVRGGGGGGGEKVHHFDVKGTTHVPLLCAFFTNPRTRRMRTNAYPYLASHTHI